MLTVRLLSCLSASAVIQNFPVTRQVLYCDNIFRMCQCHIQYDNKEPFQRLHYKINDIASRPCTNTSCNGKSVLIVKTADYMVQTRCLPLKHQLGLLLSLFIGSIYIAASFVNNNLSFFNNYLLFNGSRRSIWPNLG